MPKQKKNFATSNYKTMNNNNDTVLSEQGQVPSKSEVATMVEQLVAKVDEGEINPLRAYGQLAAIEKIAGDARKRIAEQALDEASKYPEKNINAYGATFTIKEAGVKYDYSSDPEWRDYQEQIDIVRAQQKGRETVLQSLKLCAKSSTTTLQVTMAK